MRDIAQLSKQEREEFYNNLGTAIDLTAAIAEIERFGYILLVSVGDDTDRLSNASLAESNRVLIALGERLKNSDTPATLLG